MQIVRKIKRVQPIIKMKQARVEEEASILERIRREKVDVVQAMKDYQKRYMQGVETLNQTRGSRDRANLPALETGLDRVKDQWTKLYRDVQELERKERAQIAQLLGAERELKAVERLRDRYETEHRKELGKSEQKQIDEMALRRFNERRE